MTFNWNILMAVHDGAVASAFSVVWSSNIEEWFFIFFPIVIVFIKPSRLPYFLLDTGLVSAAARLAFHLAYLNVWLAPYIFLPFRMDGLCAGGLVVLAIRNERIVDWALRHRQSLLALTWAALVLAVAAVVASQKNLQPTCIAGATSISPWHSAS